MANTAKFTQNIVFTDEIREIEFEVSWSMGGIGAYEFWGAKGHHSEPEIDEITFTEGDLNPAQIEHLQGMIDCNELDDAAWDAIAAQQADEPEPDWDMPQED